MRPALIAGTLLVAGTVASIAMTLEQIDADGDGLLTFAEVQSLHPEVTENQFAKADTDADGLLTEAELLAAQDSGLLPDDAEG